MEKEQIESTRKRMRPDEGEGAISELEMAGKEEFEAKVAGSKEVELAINQILEKIQRFTQLGAQGTN